MQTSPCILKKASKGDQSLILILILPTCIDNILSSQFFPTTALYGYQKCSSYNLLS